MIDDFNFQLINRTSSASPPTSIFKLKRILTKSQYLSNLSENDFFVHSSFFFLIWKKINKPQLFT